MSSRTDSVSRLGRIRRSARALAVGTAGLLAVSAVLAAASPAGLRAATESSQRLGIPCTSDAGANPTFTLTTRSGFINLPDGTTAFMLGYSEGTHPFQHPGPILCVNEGDTVTVVLHNTLARRVSIVFPGQHDVLADGQPAQPEIDGTGRITSLTRSAAPTTGSVTYSFVADAPGTYLYESGTDPETQVRVGLFGTLIVRPALGPGFAYDRADSAFNPATEFLALLSEIDPNLSAAVQTNHAFNFNTYHPRYWLINGRGFPDSIADNFAEWLPAQPYGALAAIHPNDKFLTNGTINPSPQNPLPSISRYLSVGTEDYPFHPHGNNGKVIGRDGTPIATNGGTGADLSFDKFAVNIGPGQTWDVLFDWKDAEGYSSSNKIPASEPDLQNLTIGTFYGGSPYLGETAPMPPGVQTLNECGEFYIIAHNHALHQLTSWGVNMTGPITYTRVNPPSVACP
jgi:FtsP/CotA-like multicopper oxidase with cupredoxin domain